MDVEGMLSLTKVSNTAKAKSTVKINPTWNIKRLENLERPSLRRFMNRGKQLNMVNGKTK